MGHGDDRAFVALEMLLQPGDGLGIQMVGGLIKQQNIWLFQEQTAEGHPPFLATGEH